MTTLDGWTHAQLDETSRAALDREFDERIAAENRRYGVRAHKRPLAAFSANGTDMSDPSRRDIAVADLANEFGASDYRPGASAREIAMQQRRAYEAAEHMQRRVRRYQPAPGLTIVDESGEPYWGTHHAAGCYIADPDLCRRAQRALVERDHLEALRRNDWMDRQRVRFALTESGRAVLAGLDLPTSSAA